MPRGSKVRITQKDPIRQDANRRVAKSTKTEAEKKLNQIQRDIEKQAKAYKKATPKKKTAKEELKDIESNVKKLVTTRKVGNTYIKIEKNINEVLSQSPEANLAFKSYVESRTKLGDNFKNKKSRTKLRNERATAKLFENLPAYKDLDETEKTKIVRLNEDITNLFLGGAIDPETNQGKIVKNLYQNTLPATKRNPELTTRQRFDINVRKFKNYTSEILQNLTPKDVTSLTTMSQLVLGAGITYIASEGIYAKFTDNLNTPVYNGMISWLTGGTNMSKSEAFKKAMFDFYNVTLKDILSIGNNQLRGLRGVGITASNVTYTQYMVIIVAAGLFIDLYMNRENSFFARMAKGVYGIANAVYLSITGILSLFQKVFTEINKNVKKLGKLSLRKLRKIWYGKQDFMEEPANTIVVQNCLQEIGSQNTFKF
tara:strand:- start:8882 stop:10162 length:1281 start_codon:yes stop_codon:yes gene_type:complete